MSGSAIFKFGSRVYCSDAECGELLQFVVDPEIPRLTDLVVCSLVAARLVAPEMAHPTRFGILLDCDRAFYDGLPAAPARGAGGSAVAQGGAGSADSADIPGIPGIPGIPEAETHIRRGDHVRALDGDAGRVLGLVVRTEDAAVTHLLLSSGHLWHRRHAAVPVDYVAGLGFAGLDVLLTKDKVADFAGR